MQCSHAASCAGSSPAMDPGVCWPKAVWASDFKYGQSYNDYSFDSGRFYVQVSASTYAFSVLVSKALKRMRVCCLYKAVSVQCGPIACAGAYEGSCYAYSVWSGSEASVGHSFSYDLLGGRFYEYYGSAGHSVIFALSVRCFGAVY